MDKHKLVVKNIVYSLITKIVTLALGVLLPRLVIVSFGSEVNGLLSTVTQIFTYLALVEAGIGNSTINALYKPIDEKNYKVANEVISEAKTYYHKVSIIYGICVVGFSLVYPYIVESSLSKPIIFGIIILQGAGSFISYYFSAVYMQLLTADGRRYIIENINFISYVFTTGIKIILILCGYDVIIVQLGFFFINVLKAPVIIQLCKKKYPWLNISVQPTTNRLKERKAFIIHELTATVFFNTDVFIISVFCSFEMASIYTVYNLVFSALNTLLTTANNGLGFTLGQIQYKNKKELTKRYDLYTSLFDCSAFILFTCAYLLIVPFIKIYTRGVTDINYIISGLPFLFTSINLLSSVRATSSLLITVSGHADNTKMRSIIEAIINITSSLVLVNIFGLKGVLLGTIIALLYRTNDMIIYANTVIIKRAPSHEYMIIGMNLIIFICITVIAKYVAINIQNYLMFIFYGMICFVIISLSYIFAMILFNKQVKTLVLHKLECILAKDAKPKKQK